MSQSFPGMTLPEPPSEKIVAPDQAPLPDLDFSSPEELTAEDGVLFETLLTIGRLHRVVTVAGHSFSIETLKDNEELELGLLIKPYHGSDSYPRAYKIAIIAASVREIDGRPVYQPLSDKEEYSSILRKKFQAWAEYYPVITDLVYAEVVTLEQELIPLVEKLKKM
jgi:hypothetical protein